MGRIYRPHGTAGAFKVIPETDDPARITRLKSVFVGRAAAAVKPLRVSSWRVMPTKQGPSLLVVAEGVETPEAAERLRGLNVYATEADLPLADDEFFLNDLIGFAVVGEEGEAFGTVREVREGPVYLLFEVETPDGQTVLVPNVPAFVLDLDLEGRRVVIRPVEGLFGEG